MAKIFKISGYFVDSNGNYDDDELGEELRHLDGFFRHLHVEQSEIDGWDDENPLNMMNCDLAECEKYFNSSPAKFGPTDRIPEVGAIYRHFKEGKLVKVLAISQDTENVGSFSVVYECKDKDNNSKIWNRPYSMFVSEVDHKKYTNATQKYRFEKVEESDAGMQKWAKQEVEIACKRERNSAQKDGELDMAEYGCSCYESALKAFNSLCEDGHSGMSIGITKSILNRLIDGKPLTPIEDTEDVWNQCNMSVDDPVTYHCKRMSALFKDVYKDGRVEYSSVDQSYGKDINTGCTYTCGLVSRIIREMYPITMPYIPEDRIEVATEEFLTDKKNGDFDTSGIYYAIVKGEKVEINRFFAESQDYPDMEERFPGWVEISKEEFDARSKKADILRVQIKKNTCENSCKLCDTCQKKEEYQNNRTYCDDFIHVDYKSTEGEI